MSSELGTSDVSEVGDRLGEAGSEVRLFLVGGIGVLAGRSMGRTGNLLEGVRGGIEARGEIGVEGTMPGKFSGTAGNLLLSSFSHSCNGGNALLNSGDGARMRAGIEGKGDDSGNRGELGSEELGEGGPKEDKDTKACGEDTVDNEGEGSAEGIDGVGEGKVGDDAESDAGFGGAGGGTRFEEVWRPWFCSALMRSATEPPD